MILKHFLIHSVVLSFISSQVLAEGTTYGIGTGTDIGNKIYFPIFSSDYLFEPTLELFDDSNLISNSSGATTETEVRGISMGIYKVKSVKDKTSIYYGSRFAYSQNETTEKTQNGRVEYEKKSSYIAPAVGAIYNLSENFTLGLDFSIQLLSQKNTTSTLTAGVATRNEQSDTKINTSTEMILRYFFK